jgi:hypothetical protein
MRKIGPALAGGDPIQSGKDIANAVGDVLGGVLPGEAGRKAKEIAGKVATGFETVGNVKDAIDGAGGDAIKAGSGVAGAIGDGLGEILPGQAGEKAKQIADGVKTGFDTADKVRDIVGGGGGKQPGGGGAIPGPSPGGGDTGGGGGSLPDAGPSDPGSGGGGGGGMPGPSPAPSPSPGGGGDAPAPAPAP